MEFAKKTGTFSKIRNMELNHVSTGIAVIFVKVANLSGLKDPISNINKLDIREMITTRFKSYSLEEINYAFTLDRYGYHGDPTPHYQLFNAEYVAIVMNKYIKWLDSIKKNPYYTEDPKETSPEERESIMNTGVIRVFDRYKETGELENKYIDPCYNHLYHKNLLPQHKKYFRNKIIKKAIKRIFTEVTCHTYQEQNKVYQLKEIQNGKKAYKEMCRKIIITTYFRMLISKKIEIQNLL
jgi:hypothetical protein